MIVTRKRRKAFPWKRLILPLIAITLVIVAFTWGPSRTAIGNSPAGPAVRAGTGMIAGVTAPLHFEAQNRLLAQRDKTIAQLQQRNSDLLSAAKNTDKRVATLQSQIDQLQAQAATTRAAAPVHVPAVPLGTTSASFGGGASSAGGAATSGDLSAGVTPDMRRTAAYWANMEPSNAAKVIQKLPIVYVARVFSVMSPDAASAIMDALPPAYVAQVTQEHPELKR